MTLTFRAASAVRAVASDCFEADIPDHWQQGRGAFGGLVFGVLVRAATATESDPARVLRTFAADVAGPVLPGPARVRVRTLRRGRSQTNLQADLEQGGEVLAVANLTLSGGRAVSAPMPPLDAPAEAREDYRERFVIPLKPPMGPVFAEHYEFRNVGPLPGSGQLTSAGFVRESAWQELPDDATLDSADLTALLDTYWPALFTLGGPLPMTTVSFGAQYLHHAVALPAREPLFFRGRVLTQSEGYAVEFRELWAGETLVALNQQTFAVLR